MVDVAASAVRESGMRAPDYIIGSVDDPYLLRWWVIPRNKWFNIYLHKFLKSDEDEALHSHPWLFNISILLKGCYTEHTAKGGKLYRAGRIKPRWGQSFHRVELTHGSCWTLFITGPVVRDWGFACANGFVPWKVFTKRRDAGALGCGD